MDHQDAGFKCKDSYEFGKEIIIHFFPDGKKFWYRKQDQTPITQFQVFPNAFVNRYQCCQDSVAAGPRIEVVPRNTQDGDDEDSRNGPFFYCGLFVIQLMGVKV